MPKITGVIHVELSVSDLDRSVAWYCSLLDANDVFRGSDEKEDIVDCAILEPISGMVLAFTQHGHQEGGPFTPRRVGLDHVAFGVESAEELEAWREKMDSLGIEHSPINNYGYALALTCKDPDGIPLEFFHSTPRRRAEGT